MGERQKVHIGLSESGGGFFFRFSAMGGWGGSVGGRE
jgi:hypothetical protein